MDSTKWTEGMPAQVVEHDEATRQPKPGGRVYPATVTHAEGVYVRAEFLVPEPGAEQARDARTALSFSADSGWPAWDGMFTWRLLPAGDTASPAACACGHPAGVHDDGIGICEDCYCVAYRTAPAPVPSKPEEV